MSQKILSTKILSISGPRALSSFRLRKLLGEIREQTSRVSSLDARFVHFVDLGQSLTDEEREHLTVILDYGARDDEVGASLGGASRAGISDGDVPMAKAISPPVSGRLPGQPHGQSHGQSHGQLVLIAPRPGTVSPWSSKASDIARRCGLSAIRRIERGIAFRVGLDADAPLAGQALESVAALLHDPMTQTVLYDLTGIDASFTHRAPAPIEYIPLSRHGREDPNARIATLEAANQELGLALGREEIAYLAEGFAESKRDPSDVELMMFAQVNSEHCRHKVFNSAWILDGVAEEHSLFDMIKSTHAPDKGHILSAYADNAAVMRGMSMEEGGTRFYPHPRSRRYSHVPCDVHILMKVETHNHPTAISPYPGAATGSGGEIRDEAATGRGARAKAGLTGFSVSNLRIPGFVQPWERDFGRPLRIASSLAIMLEGPVGAAGFNNEFGRPALLGYFRTFETSVTDSTGDTRIHGYHKPIMVAGGLGNIGPDQVKKCPLPLDAPILVLGGPAMLIGLGGGAASSLASGTTREALDFASVQRENPEMQRRCQEVIDRCWQMGKNNPILSIHDVGAGGLSNAVPELIHGGGKGGRFELRAIPNDDPGMSPLALWCNESQERYVLAVEPHRLDEFLSLCRKERCPCAVLGKTSDELRLVLSDASAAFPTTSPSDSLADSPSDSPSDSTTDSSADSSADARGGALHAEDRHPIDIPLSFLFGDPPRMVRNATRIPTERIGIVGWAKARGAVPIMDENRSVTDRAIPITEGAVSIIDEPDGHGASRLCPSYREISLNTAAYRILRLPAVASKGFLITIGDRSVTGLVSRDQMVGPWQVPVADCAVTASGFEAHRGEAMAMGERAPVALADAPASGRLAVAEAITNIACAPIEDIEKIALSANWMAACGHPGEDAKLFDTVRAVTELCHSLGITIPVGKDSLSMKTVWRQDGQSRSVTAPLSLIVSSFAPVLDVRRTLTPQLCSDEETDLILIDLGRGRNRLGGSSLAQVCGETRGKPADLDHPEDLQAFFKAIQMLNRADRLLAYHDRSDGGLFATLCEMAFAAHTGITIHLDGPRNDSLGNDTLGNDRLGDDPPSILFSEEPGVIVQVRRRDVPAVYETMKWAGMPSEHVHRIGGPNPSDTVEFRMAGETILSEPRISLQRAWSETSYRMQALRDNPRCAEEEYQGILDAGDPGITPHVGFELSAGIPDGNTPDEDILAPFLGGARPRMAILREQGVNGHVEMAAAFHRAGFDCFDVHMSDIIEGDVTLADYHGLAACGGFSYGDVLGAGGGWASSILYNPRARDAFAAFFSRPDTFSLGVCNGCQMLSRLTSLIPGAEHWPRFVRNLSEQFEARLTLCEVLPSPSLLLTGMAGARLPIVVAHGEGLAEFSASNSEAGNQGSAGEGKGNLDDPRSAIPGDPRGTCLRYVDNRGNATERYPANPNGSPGGVTGFASSDGRVTIMMPHPERMFRTCQYSWHPDDWGEDGPWLRMFRNARRWVGEATGG
uniref:Phosphoribosylformylglycinamidine synthase n=1 Tax=Candidatus Kentrum sp. LFY TaxID=2126342 RepID=A0A450URI3_9GAMM|nr:MAG: phosphoribosylformylglycinamidine synthase [Candidatus Kentron sp. LFY]